jgi:hypothetical protein
MSRKMEMEVEAMRNNTLLILAAVALTLVLSQAVYAQGPVYYGQPPVYYGGPPTVSLPSVYASYPVYPLRYSRVIGAPIFILDQLLPPGYILGQPMFDLPPGLTYATNIPPAVYVMHYNPSDYYYGPQF